MKGLLDLVTVRADRHYMIPVVVGPNRVELPTFIRAVMERRRLDERHLVVSIDPRTILRLELADTAIILQGEKLTPAILDAFARLHLVQLRGVIIFVNARPSYDGNPFNELTRLGWSADLLTHCHVTAWPVWNDRKEDHRQIIVETYRRQRIPRSRRPILDEATVEYLEKNVPFSGSDDVVRRMEQAIAAYLDEEDTDDLRITHFQPREGLAPATTHPDQAVDMTPVP